MNLDNVVEDIEEEQEWRERELRFLHNQLTLIPDTGHKDLFRRALIVMLYAHFEGFCRFLFLIYVRAVNELKLPCSKANYALAAAALSDLFSALRDPSGKCSEFKNELPDDTKLHVFAREREFVERSHAFAARTVEVPDSVVELDGNLKPVVLRKILYRLGLPHGLFSPIEKDINMLLNYRNGVAHGGFRPGIDENDYEPIKTTVLKTMNDIKHEVIRALRERRYLRTS